jgi:IS5 family transposase
MTDSSKFQAQIYVAVDCNSLLLVSIIISRANEHDATKFVDVMENADMCFNNAMTHHIKEAYADKAYDSKSIRQYLSKRRIKDMIPRRQYNIMSGQL